MLAFAVTCGAISLLLPYAGRLGLLVAPGEHRRHGEPTPAVGGLAIFAGLVAGTCAIGDWSFETSCYLGGGALLVFTGYLDDRHLIPIGYKTAAQIAAALLLVWGGHDLIFEMGNLLGLGEIHLGWMIWPFTIFAVVGLINAINMLDGIDGLAGSVTLAIILPLAWISLSAGGILLGPIIVLAAAVCGFLCFNLRWGGYGSARTFMGDTGSMVLGYSLAWFVIVLSQEPVNAVPPMAVLWILIVPVMDTFRIMALRVMRRRSPFAPDTTHLHHILVMRGLPINTVVALAFLITLFFSAVALLLSSLPFPGPVLFYGFAGLFFIYLAVTARMLRRSRRPRHSLTQAMVNEGQAQK